LLLSCAEIQKTSYDHLTTNLKAGAR